MIHEDGSASGTAFEYFSAVDIIGLQTTYSALDIRAELRNADQFLAKEFERDGTEFGAPERMERLHLFLNKRNRAQHALIVSQQAVIRAKAETARDESCWFEEDRLMVANGFKHDLLQLVGDDEKRLRIALDKAAIHVPIDLKGLALRKAVRGYVTRTIEWSGHDERKTRAVERSRTEQQGAAPESQAERSRRILDAALKRI